ncbi:MAG: glycoside hydrolase family 43 protein [Bacteroidales bacterium]|nr:glycoside hydrolase family 43 protein [Bacteroidales bacterium]
MKPLILIILTYSLIIFSCKTGTGESEESYSGNPVLPGWYADPEGIIIDNEYWIFPTWSDRYGDSVAVTHFTEQQLNFRSNAINKQYLKQTYLDAFSSPDLVHWEKHPVVLSVENVDWAAYSVWAPSIVEGDGRYYLFFSANDIQSNEETGGIGVAVADRPEGPYKDELGKPLIGEFHNGAQPIDQHVFRDDDNQYYMYYGGWRHCNVVKLANDLLSLLPFEDGVFFKEITPENYVEGPFMLKRKGLYYLMWSEGGWGGPGYSVAYAIGDSPVGPFERIGKILQQDSTVATGAGHHSVISIPGKDEYFIVYHRRPLDTDNPHHRVVCIDKLTFDEEGFIEPVKITFKGVKRQVLN